MKRFPIHAAVGSQGKGDLLVKRGWTIREDQRLDLHLPAIQIPLREQRVAFLWRFHIEDDNPAGLPDEVIVEDRQRQGRVPDKGIQDAICLGCRQVAWRESMEKKTARLANSFSVFVHEESPKLRN